jgi:hypothetical protein
VGNLLYYEAFGLVHKVIFTSTGLRVIVDINIRSPIDSREQNLPDSNPELYEEMIIEYSAIHDAIDVSRIKYLMEKF